MTAKRTRTAQGPPPGADDFRRIDGIGPAIAQRLYTAGITTFAQLAALSPEEIAAQLDGQAGVTIARIAEEQWAAQARALAEGQADVDLVEESQGAVGERATREELPVEAALDEAAGPHHHASFAITLLLNPDNTVSRTRIAYAPPEGGEEKDSWLRWDAERLVAFIVRTGRLSLPAAQGPAGAEPPDDGARPTPRLNSLALVLPSSQAPLTFLSDRHTYMAQLELSLAELQASGARLGRFVVSVRAKRLGSGARVRVGEARGSIGGETELRIVTSARISSVGLYRLEAELQLEAAAGEPPYYGAYTLPGDLFYVY